MRLGKSQGSLLFKPNGSASVPKVGVKGTPSLALKIAPTSQPFVIHPAGPPSDLSEGTSQVPLITSVLSTLKSDSPRLNLKLGQNSLDIVCRLLLQIKET